MVNAERLGKLSHPFKEILRDKGETESFPAPDTVLQNPLIDLIPPLMHPDFGAFCEYTGLGKEPSQRHPERLAKDFPQ